MRRSVPQVLRISCATRKTQVTADMNIDHTLIANLHHQYKMMTGLDLRLDFERERQWWEWCKRGNTVDDLILVVNYLKKAVYKKERNPGCLKFHNLIGNADYFDEDKALCKALSRQPRVDHGKEDVLRATGRPTQAQPTARSAEDIMKGEEEFKKLVALKNSL